MTGLATSDGETFYFSVGSLLHEGRLVAGRFTDITPRVSAGYGPRATRGFVEDHSNLLLHLSDEDGRLHIFRKPRRQVLVHTYNLRSDRAMGTESDLPVPAQGTLLGVCGWLEPQPSKASQAGFARVETRPAEALAE